MHQSGGRLAEDLLDGDLFLERVGRFWVNVVLEGGGAQFHRDVPKLTILLGAEITDHVFVGMFVTFTEEGDLPIGQGEATGENSLDCYVTLLESSSEHERSFATFPQDVARVEVNLANADFSVTKVDGLDAVASGAAVRVGLRSVLALLLEGFHLHMEVPKAEDDHSEQRHKHHRGEFVGLRVQPELHVHVQLGEERPQADVLLECRRGGRRSVQLVRLNADRFGTLSILLKTAVQLQSQCRKPTILVEPPRRSRRNVQLETLVRFGRLIVAEDDDVVILNSRRFGGDQFVPGLQLRVVTPVGTP